MNPTRDLIQRALNLCMAAMPSKPKFGDASTVNEVPTLDPDVRRPVSPMLRERFLFCGAWELATHGDWLSVDEMILIANNDTDDPRIAEIIVYKDSAALDWPNDAGGLFRPDRLSLFAGSDVTYERVYLLWVDDAVEPEVWVYDTNGNARYRDLEQYLNAYLSDDLSSYEKRWILAG